MARLTVETKTFDYKDYAGFLKHACEMQDKGWVCIDDHPWSDNGVHKYHTATFKRGVLFNGINGRGEYDTSKNF